MLEICLLIVSHIDELIVRQDEFRMLEIIQLYGIYVTSAFPSPKQQTNRMKPAQSAKLNFVANIQIASI